MTNWHRGPLAAFDTETTGIDVDTDRMVSAAIVQVDGSTGNIDTRSWLIEPGIEIPQAATEIHGITTAHVREHGTPAAEAIGEIAGALAKVVADGVPVVVYNAVFDLTLLDREMRRHGHHIDFAGGLRVIDPLVIDKHADQFRRGSRKLTDVCRHHQVRFDGDAHGAPTDALAAARLAWKLAHTNVGLSAMSIHELHDNQIGWRAEQAASLQAYLRRTKDPEAVVEGQWPIIPATSR